MVILDEDLVPKILALNSTYLATIHALQKLEIKKEIITAFIDYQSKSAQNGAMGQPLTTRKKVSGLGANRPPFGRFTEYTLYFKSMSKVMGYPGTPG